jgi:hypothetical protein
LTILRSLLPCDISGFENGKWGDSMEDVMENEMGKKGRLSYIGEGRNSVGRHVFPCVLYIFP